MNASVLLSLALQVPAPAGDRAYAGPAAAVLPPSQAGLVAVPRAEPAVRAAAASPIPEQPAAPTPAARAKTPATPEFSGAPGKGLTVRFGDVFSLNVKSRVQVRYQLDVPQDAASREDLRQLIGIGTARLWFSGNLLTPKLTYMIQLAVAPRDYRDGATSPLYDAYVDWKVHRDFAFRVGQYFVPFDRLRTIREVALQMTDRPRPVQELTLDRDVGLTTYSEKFLGDKSPVAWRLGVFSGGGMNASVAKEPGALVAARLELRPWGPIDDDSEGDLERRKIPGLALGGAFAANFATNRLRSTTGPTFAGGTTDYLHAAADLVFKWRGLALQGEYLWKRASTPRIVSVDANGAPLVEYTRSGQGWIAQASYVFDPPIELVARLAGLYALRETDPTLTFDLEAHGQEVGSGINYYFEQHRMKLQAGWIARMPYDFAIREASHGVSVLFDVTF
jgi:hypothetical protein